MIAAAAGGLKHIEGACGVHFEVAAGIIDRSSDCYLGGEMVDLGRRRGGLLHRVRITDVRNGDAKAPGALREFLQPLEVVFDLATRKIVKNMNLRIGVGQKVMGPVGAHESGAAEDQYGTG